VRPRKTVLCVDADADALSRRCFLLETRGFRVLRATSSEDAAELLRHHKADALVAEYAGMESTLDALLRSARAYDPELKTLVTSLRSLRFDATPAADVFLHRGAMSPIELLERLRILVARRHGPKPGTKPCASAQPDGRARSPQTRAGEAA
jgi:two-component system response regulator CpxR